jgi:hypothetical protein
MVAAMICSAGAALAGYEVFDPDRPLDVRFWTGLLIGAAALTLLAVQRVVAKPRSESPGAELGGEADGGRDPSS